MTISGEWSNQPVLSPLVIITSGAPTTGFFVYSGTPGKGNPPVFSVVAPGVTTDPYGNAVQDVVQAGGSGSFTRIESNGTIVLYGTGANPDIIIDPIRSAMFFYSPTAGAGNLTESIAVAAGTDVFGNADLPGNTTYFAGGTRAVQVYNAAITFYTAPSSAGPWTAGPSITTDATGLHLDAVTAGLDLTLLSHGTGLVKAQSQLQVAYTTAGPVVTTDPNNSSASESWHSLGALGVTGLTVNAGRYRMLPDGDVEIDFSFSTSAAVSAFFATFANTLLTAYQPAQEKGCGIGASGGAWTISSTRIPSLLVTPTGSVQVSMPAIASGVVGGCTFRYPTN